MPRRKAPEPRLDRVVKICLEHHESVALRSALLEAIGRTVPFDAHAWLMTDPATEVGSAPLAHVPCFHELAQAIRLKYLTALNRWTTLDPPVASLQLASNGAPEQSRLWRELLHRYDVVDVASLVFRDQYGCWGFLDLWRTGERHPFTEPELTFLMATSKPITEALRMSQARTFDTVAPTRTRTGPAVLVLSADLQVNAQTSETEAYLRELIPPDPERQPVPAAAYNVAAQLLANESGVDAHPPTARVHLTAGTWITLRAARIDRSGPPGREEIAVSIEHASPSERLDLFARAWALTKRETDLLEHLASGATTREIAARMYLAELTVQDHLKSMFHKTGVHSRSALLARFVGR